MTDEPEDDYTPQWIKDWCALPEHDGGWFFPMLLSETHPLVTEKWVCNHCEEDLGPEDVAAIMPFHIGRVWLAYHRACVLEQLGLTEEPE